MSKTIALVIEDDEEIRNIVVERLDSLGHDSDAVGSQSEARKKIENRRYDYILLDLEIPMRFGRPSDIAIGKNVLAEIRSSENNSTTPVLIATAHGHDEPDLAVELMKGGANDFIKKPLKGLEDKIREALRKNTGVGEAYQKRSGNSQKTQEMPDAEVSSAPTILRFTLQEITLEDTPICHSGSGTIWNLLMLLRQRRENGSFRAFPAKALADNLRLPRGQGAVCEVISKFRQSVKDVFRQSGVTVDGDAVITTGKYGYQLNPDLEVIDEINDDVCPGAAETQKEIESRDRADWILEQVKSGKKLQRRDIEDHFSISSSTAKRDLKLIEDQIEFVGTSRNGHYALKKGSRRK